MPKVSVIIPVYGVERYIERCARNLFCQKLDDIEFIFIDDCSPDHSMDILNRVIQEKRVQITEKNWIVRTERMSSNSGQAAIRTYGVHLATGDYVIHCDSDDWISEDMLSDMWKTAKKGDYDVVVCDYVHVKGTINDYHKGMLHYHDTDSFLRELLLVESSWVLWNKMFRRTIYNNITYPKAGMNNGEDMVLVVQLLYYCKSIGYVNKALYNYCDNSDSISNAKELDGVLNNFLQWSENIRIIDSFFNEKKEKKDEMVYLKFFVKRRLLQSVDFVSCYRIWMSLFKENNLAIITNPYIHFKDVVLYYKFFLMGCFRYFTN